ncbi:MAG TPA: hypothetical protein DEO70_12095 [Bacteroidales bacterium]|nr:MAG: hypothetical protein A2X11_10085 [Bacteroidetes bacterium GWE2_42_24]OFY25861.1 MAG: hypothetical protein A2X09_09460 [Bacteroidetes bacterium GWF2_43_11]HBZ67569.1 hypothetical protein [Bacteroidales bacterium]
MKNKNHISKLRIKLYQEKLERLKRKSASKKRLQNIANNKRVSSIRETKHKNESLFNQPKEATVSSKSDFTLLDFPENVLSFIKMVDEVTKKKKYKTIFFDISQVTSIDIGSIGLLLSKINELSTVGIKVKGNFPENAPCKKIICESGFLSHMNDMKGRRFNYLRGESNLMVSRGFDRTSNVLVGSAIRKAVKHLTGVDESYRPLYSLAQEMCANSVEHANEHHHSKNWLFSVTYKNADTVCFTMTDIGRGILGTLKRKASQIIKEVLLSDDKDILGRAFDKQYTSKTKDINRNKGLPKIKSIADNNFINNFVVITNNVLLDFSNNNNSKLLNKKFDGTFYYWELNKKCIETWKIRKSQ